MLSAALSPLLTELHFLGMTVKISRKHKLDISLIECDLTFTGSSGIIVRLSTNHFRLTSRPQWALYQYHIDYNPLMEARRLRSALLFQHEDLIGRCHAFDGTILFLPKRLQHKVISVVGMGRGKWGFPPQSQTATF